MVLAVVVGLVVLGSLLTLVLVPARTSARQLIVSPGSPTSATFSVTGPSWVTVHVDRHGTAGMSYWMDGPSGRMFNRSMMGNGGMMGGGFASDSSSFWSWGGEYRCWAQYTAAATGPMPVWVNVTTAIW